MPFHVDAVGRAHGGKIGINSEPFYQHPQLVQLFNLRFLRPVPGLNLLVQLRGWVDGQH